MRRPLLSRPDTSVPPRMMHPGQPAAGSGGFGSVSGSTERALQICGDGAAVWIFRLLFQPGGSQTLTGGTGTGSLKDTGPGELREDCLRMSPGQLKGRTGPERLSLCYAGTANARFWDFRKTRISVRGKTAGERQDRA